MLLLVMLANVFSLQPLFLLLLLLISNEHLPRSLLLRSISLYMYSLQCEFMRVYGDELEYASGERKSENGPGKLIERAGAGNNIYISLLLYVGNIHLRLRD